MKAQLRWLVLFVRGAFSPTRKNALRGAVLTFSLSLLPLSLIYVLVGGMTRGIYERSVETFYYHAQLESPSFDPRTDLAEETNIPDLDGIWEEKQGFGILISPDEDREAILLRGLEPDFLASPNFWRYLSNGNNEPLSSPLILGADEIAIGKSVAQNLRLKKGDSVNLITTREIAGRRVARLSPFRVKEVISTGYAELDRTWGLVSLFAESGLFDPKTESIWGVKFKNMDLEEIPSLTDELNNREDSLVHWTAWTELNQNQRENFQSLEVLFYVLFSLIVVVASFNVSSALIIYTVEQARTLAIFKALGIAPSWLRLGFTLIGALIGFLGAVLGLFLSLILTVILNPLLALIFGGSDWIYRMALGFWGINLGQNGGTLQDSYYLSEISASLPFSFLVIILGVSVLLTTLASLWASARLVDIKPKLLLN